jgi:hypothetical protein
VHTYDDLTRTDLDRIARRLNAPAAVCADAGSCARADALALLGELRRTRLALALARGRYADLLAAARATLAAHHDGEHDPLAYLRDQLEHDDDHLAPTRAQWDTAAERPIPYLPTARARRALRNGADAGQHTPGGDAA